MPRLLLLRCCVSFTAVIKFSHNRFSVEELMAKISNVGYDINHTQKSIVNLGCSTSWRMWLISACALLVILQSSLTDSFRSLILAFIAVIFAIMTELLFLVKSGKLTLLRDGSVVASAFVFVLFLPNMISPVYAAAGSIFAIAVIKHSFGGLGSNWLNPAAGGWLFVRLSWPTVFEKALEGSPLSVLGENVAKGFINYDGLPLEILKINNSYMFSQSSFFETHVRPFLNNTVFSFLGIELPASYMNLFANTHPGIIADRGIPMLIFGAILIIAFKISRSYVPVIWLAIFAFFTWMTGAIPFGSFPRGQGFWKGDILFTFLTGGTLASAFILASDPATSAKSIWLVIVSAAVGGFFAWLLRFPGSEPFGAIFSVVIINSLLPVVSNIVRTWPFTKGTTS